MKPVYLKHKLFNLYYKIVDGKSVLTINLNIRYFKIDYTDDIKVLNDVSKALLVKPITKEEFDIVMNDAILKMIEISIL